VLFGTNDMFTWRVDLLRGQAWDITDHCDALIHVERNEPRVQKLITRLRKKNWFKYDVLKIIKKMDFSANEMGAEKFVAYMLDVGIKIHGPQAD